MRGREILGAALIVAACTNEPTGPYVYRPLPPVIDAAAATANPHNVLSAVVAVLVRHSDSVAVRFRLANSPAATDSVSPAVPADEAGMAIAVLGLLPASRYVFRAVAYGPDGVVAGDSLDLTTGPLPADLPTYVASGPDPSPGYLVLAAGVYAVAIDNTGRVVWYRRFPGGAGLNLMAQPTGRYVLRPLTPDPADVERWVELDPLGEVTRTLDCALGLRSRLHDLLLQPDGSYWILCDETRTMDLSALGGVAGARVTGTVVQHVGAAGELLFHWSPFDHFAITDLEAAERTGPNVNWTHGNALDIAGDGSLILSFRSLGEITKIDVKTGAVIWRMGGLRNEFSFLDTSMPPFSRQHSARACAPGALLLLDNLGDPTESRAERYLIDEGTRTARLEHSYGTTPSAVTLIGGSVQSLGDGRTLVSFGTAGRVEEYDETGRVVWRIEGNPGYVFRAQRIRSLYAPGIGTAR